MESIDITDSAFSLDMVGPNTIIDGGSSVSDYTMYIYIGVAALVILIGMFIYRYYQNKANNQNSRLDCEGGFCTMNQMPSS